VLRFVLLTLLPLAPLAFGVGPAQGSSSPSGSSGGATVNADFNGDDYADLAVGVPEETLEGRFSAGAVNVLYGTSTGLSAFGSQFWHQDIPELEGDGAEMGDRFGSALAAGDFNGDGFADLAVGTPEEDLDVDMDAGAVNVLYGSPAGLSIDGNQSWTQGSLGLGDFDTASEEGDLFGNSLAAANFGKSNHVDLAIGVTREDMGTVQDAGAVNVIYGSGTGLAMAGAQFWHQDSPGVVGDGVEENDLFASSLAAANFGKTTHADLAVGVSQEGVGTIPGAGAVHVLYGSSTGLTASGDQFWHQNSSGIANAAEDFDQFGLALAVANFGNGSHADLAVGVSSEDFAFENGGAVNVIYGSSVGLTASGNQFWHQNVPGIADTAGEDDQFGYSLAAANFGRTTQADLAVGVGQGDAGAFNAGQVSVIYGSSTGLTASGDQLWHQDVSGVVGDGAEENDRFGDALAAADFGKATQADLAVGVPGEGLGAAPGAGAVNVLYGRSTGLNATGDQFWHQNISGVAGDGAEQNDAFGARLAAVR
jgi:disulfide bond formation protein DsbB